MLSEILMRRLESGLLVNKRLRIAEHQRIPELVAIGSDGLLADH